MSGEKATIPWRCDQIIDYPPRSGADSGYTFSLYAFAEERFPQILSEFFQFTREYFERTGYRANLIYVGYRIAQDQNSLLSYSFDGPVITIDPVSTANPGGTTTSTPTTSSAVHAAARRCSTRARASHAPRCGRRMGHG